jgi:3-oxoacyl-[acyl-carrier protein] reductase
MGDSLSRQVGIVTGGGRGLGATLAAALAKEGMAVAVTGRDASTLDHTASRLRELGARTLAIPADVTDADAVERLVDRVARELGPVDLLVNNAGITEDGPVWESNPDEWWQVVEVNLRGPYLCSRAVLPEMVRRGRGRIVNISSGVGNAPSADQTAYAVSKAGLTRFTDSLAAQTAPFRVSVFALSPGPLRTDMGVALSARRGEELDWVEPDLAARVLVRICEGAFDQLSGRFIDVRNELDEMLQRAEEIVAQDMQQLRLRQMEPRPHRMGSITSH